MKTITLPNYLFFSATHTAFFVLGKLFLCVLHLACVTPFPLAHSPTSTFLFYLYVGVM